LVIRLLITLVAALAFAILLILLTRVLGSLSRSAVPTMAERAKLQAAEFIHDHELCPSTATVTPWSCEPCRPGLWRVHAYVDSQNVFGAMIRRYLTIDVLFLPADASGKVFLWERAEPGHDFSADVDRAEAEAERTGKLPE
jgi:hypothetical protein